MVPRAGGGDPRHAAEEFERSHRRRAEIFQPLRACRFGKRVVDAPLRDDAVTGRRAEEPPLVARLGAGIARNLYPGYAGISARVRPDLAPASFRCARAFIGDTGPSDIGDSDFISHEPNS